MRSRIGLTVACLMAGSGIAAAPAAAGSFAVDVRSQDATVRAALFEICPEATGDDTGSTACGEAALPELDPLRVADRAKITFRTHQRASAVSARFARLTENGWIRTYGKTQRAHRAPHHPLRWRWRLPKRPRNANVLEVWVDGLANRGHDFYGVYLVRL
jgi:hypothetical protein